MTTASSRTMVSAVVFAAALARTGCWQTSERCQHAIHEYPGTDGAKP
jgi:hypothetical protein